MSDLLENAIVRVYGETPVAVEPILTTAIHRNEFVTKVRLSCPYASEDEILQHLVRLRKRGEAKGGLPRKAKYFVSCHAFCAIASRKTATAQFAQLSRHGSILLQPCEFRRASTNFAIHKSFRFIFGRDQTCHVHLLVLYLAIPIPS